MQISQKSRYHLESGIGCFGKPKCTNEQEYVSLLVLYRDIQNLHPKFSENSLGYDVSKTFQH